MAEPTLIIDRLKVYFVGRRGVARTVDDVTVSLQPGETLGLVAAPGSGKSVLVWSTIGLPPPGARIVGGRVYLAGADLLSMSEANLRRLRGKEISLVPQNARSHLNPLARVGDQIANVYRAHVPSSAREASAKAVELLELVAIPDPQRRATAYPHELSGGMAQRVMIAMAIAHAPKVLLADEPTMGLDVTIQSQVLDLLASQVRRLGSSTLLVTRDMGIVANYCQRVGVMNRGKIVELAEVSTFFRRPLHPYSIALLESLSFSRSRSGASLAQRASDDPHRQLLDALGSSSDSANLAAAPSPELVEVEPGHYVRS